MTVTACPRLNIVGHDGSLQPSPVMTVEQLRRIIQLGIVGESGNPPTASAVSNMQSKVIFFVLGGCHTLTAWRNVQKPEVRHPNGIVDSYYIGVFRDDP
jgi:hypothetical protein